MNKSFWKPIKRKPIKRKKQPITFGLKLPRRIPKKDLTWKQAKKRYPKLKPLGDYDRDGVKNKFDCRPFDWRRQDKKTRKEIKKTIMAPDRIIITPSGRRINVNYPTRKELEEDMKGKYGKEVPPKKRQRIITKKHLIRVFEKNPDLAAKYRKAGVTVKMKNSFDAIHASDNYAGYKTEIRSLGTYRPAFREVEVNPILDVMDSTPLQILKHEAVHIGQDINPKTIEKDEKEARLEMWNKTERYRKHPQAPQTLQSLEQKENIIDEPEPPQRTTDINHMETPDERDNFREEYFEDE